MSTTELIQLIVGCLAIISVLYQVARVERVIYSAIDAVKDSSDRNYFELQKRLDLHLQEYASRRQQSERDYNDLNIELQSKYSRLREHQRDIEGYLSRTSNFKVRTHYTTEHSFFREEENN